MDKVTLRIIFATSVIGFTLGILGLIAGIVYLASIKVTIPDVMQIVLVSLIGGITSTVALFSPSPLQQAQRRSGDFGEPPVTVKIDQPANDPVPVEAQ